MTFAALLSPMQTLRTSFVAACYGPSLKSVMLTHTWLPCVPICRTRRALPCWMACWTWWNLTRSRSSLRASATSLAASSVLPGTFGRPRRLPMPQVASQAAAGGRLPARALPTNGRLHVPTLLRSRRFVWHRWRFTCRRLLWKCLPHPLRRLAGTCADSSSGGPSSDEADPALPLRVGVQYVHIQMRTSEHSHSWSSPGPKSRAGSRSCDDRRCPVQAFRLLHRAQLWWVAFMQCLTMLHATGDARVAMSTPHMAGGDTTFMPSNYSPKQGRSGTF